MNAEVLDALYRIAKHGSFLIEYLNFGAHEMFVVRTDQTVMIAQLFGSYLSFRPDNGVDATNWINEIKKKVVSSGRLTVRNF